MNKSIKELEEEIIEEFSLFDDWMGKYEYIIELGKNLPLIDPKFKTEEFKVKGCQSQVWLSSEMKDGNSSAWRAYQSTTSWSFWSMPR